MLSSVAFGAVATGGTATGATLGDVRIAGAEGAGGTTTVLLVPVVPE